MKRAAEKGNRKRISGWLMLVGMLQVMLVMLALPGTAFSASVILDWDPSIDTELAGYRVYYQANSAALPFSGVGAVEGNAPVDVATSNSATINGLDSGSSYYFAVTAYNAAGAESVYSNIVEIKESVPPLVSISSPAPSTSVSGTVMVVAAATDNKGVTGVEFYLNGVLQSTDNTAPYTYNWDTSSLGTGMYTLMAKAFDEAGNVGQSEVMVAVAGDTTPPAVDISAPGNNVQVSGTVTISGSASDNTGVTKMELYDNGALVFAGNQTPFSYNWNSVTAANGSHLLTVKAFDVAGNIGSATVSVQVVNDFSAPVVAIASPANGGTVGATVNVSATATDDIGVTLVEFYVDGILQSSDNSAPYGFNWNTAALANGPYSVIAKAYDAAGRIGQSASVSVIVSNDTTAPVVSIASPAANSTVSGTVSVAANASDNVAVTKVDFYLDGVYKATAVSAPYSYTWNTTASANGAYTLTAKAYDAASNIGQSSTVTVNVFNDTAAPSVSIASPASGSTVDASVAVTVNASDNVAVTRTDLYLNGSLLSTSNGAGLNFNWNTSTLANGTYQLSAKAYDAAGNVGQSTNVAVTVLHPTVDTVAPVITISAPGDSVYTSSVRIKASASDNVAVTKVEVYVDGARKAVTNRSYVSATVKLSVGRHTVTVKAYDKAGNVSTSSKTVTRY